MNVTRRKQKWQIMKEKKKEFSLLLFLPCLFNGNMNILARCHNFSALLAAAKWQRQLVSQWICALWSSAHTMSAEQHNRWKCKWTSSSSLNKDKAMQVCRHRRRRRCCWPTTSDDEISWRKREWAGRLAGKQQTGRPARNQDQDRQRINDDDDELCRQIISSSSAPLRDCERRKMTSETTLRVEQFAYWKVISH